ncbi:MAG: stage 0 sporulation family protein [Clostridia bacterium]|nr:stage 0 sporulation family protein [Clostridia bacterium]
MVSILGVRFKNAGKIYYFDPQGIEANRGDYVVVETSRGIEYGEVIHGIKEVEDSVITKPLKGVLRIATEEDTRRFNENKEKEKEAYKICIGKIEEHGLEMKLVEVEYTFDGSKILFYFTSDGRVDFRELVKDLAAVFKTRIELRQIGVRDESKSLGSIGVCGRNLCCSQFLDEFVPVSIKMAKEQGLSLNPTKISGACGRLMCCLKYEQDTYEELNRLTPSTGTVVETPDGKGTVAAVSLLKGRVSVRLEAGDETTLRDFAVDEVEVYNPDKKPQKKAEELPQKPVEKKQVNAVTEDSEGKTEKPKRRNRNRNRKKKPKTDAE